MDVWRSVIIDILLGLIIVISFSNDQGTLVTVPCSHVGHIFRKRSPYKWLPGVNVVKKNAVRVAEVWLDEYKVNSIQFNRSLLLRFFSM